MSYALDTKKIKYLIAAFSTDYKNDKDEEIQEAILDQIGDLAKDFEKDVNQVMMSQEQLKRDIRMESQELKKEIEDMLKSQGDHNDFEKKIERKFDKF